MYKFLYDRLRHFMVSTLNKSVQLQGYSYISNKAKLCPQTDKYAHKTMSGGGGRVIIMRVK